MVQGNVLSAGIGEQVRRRRDQRGMTSAELARRAGLAKATLANLEAGRGNPTIDTLDAIAQALGIPLADIIVTPSTAATVMIASTPTGAERVHQQLLHRIPGGHQVESWRLRMEPGESFDGVPHADGTREQLIVMRGGLRAGHTEDLRELGPGDSLVFDGTLAHRYIAGPDGVDALVLLTSPA